MEVKIGVADSPRELVVSSEQSQEEVEALISEAMGVKGSNLLTLVDEKGGKFLVPSARITYVEIAPADSRRVGFAIGS